MLGAGSSVVGAGVLAAGRERPFLMMIGCSASAVAGVLFAATTETAGLDEFAPDPGLLWCGCASSVTVSVSEAVAAEPVCCAVVVELGAELDATDDGLEDGVTVAALGAICGTAAGVTTGRTATWEGTVADPPEIFHCVHASYPPAAIRTTAATASSAFLLPPPADFASLLTLPPNVNDGAGAEVSSAEEPTKDPAEEPLAPSATFSTTLSGSGITAEGLSSVETPGFGSRAGAGALPALAPNPVELSG